MRSFLRRLFPRPVSSSSALTAPALGIPQIVVPVIHASDLPRR